MNVFEILLAIFMLYRAVVGSFKGLIHNPWRKLHTIEKRQAAGCCTLAKVSCHIIKGSSEYPQHYREYVYKVDDRLYYVTYRVETKLLDDKKKKKWFSSGPLRRFFKQDKINEVQLLDHSNTLAVFYDPKHPGKVLCKQEAFISPDAMKKVRTKRDNPHRIIGGDWYHAVDLRNS